MACVPERMSGSPATIGIVDDQPAVRRALRRLLTRAGYEVREFGSSEEVLDSDLSGLCPCLILDIVLPGLSGLQLHRRLRDLGYEVPVIYLTGHDTPETAAQAMAAGAIAFFGKPVDRRALLDAVELALTLDGRSL